MRKRIAIGLAWWLAVAYCWEFVAAMYGLPRTIGPILALIAAGLVIGLPRDIAWRLTSRRITRSRLVKAGMGGPVTDLTRT